MPRHPDSSDDSPKTHDHLMATAAEIDKVRLTTKQALDAQPKVRVKLPMPRNIVSDKPQYVIVGVNGHNYMIQCGKEVMVPQTVYDILAESDVY